MSNLLQRTGTKRPTNWPPKAGCFRRSDTLLARDNSRNGGSDVRRGLSLSAGAGDPGHLALRHAGGGDVRVRLPEAPADLAAAVLFSAVGDDRPSSLPVVQIQERLRNDRGDPQDGRPESERRAGSRGTSTATAAGR